MSYCPWESVSLSPLPEAPPAVRTFCRRLLSLEYPSSTYDFVHEHRFVMLHLSGSRDDEDPHANTVKIRYPPSRAWHFVNGKTTCPIRIRSARIIKRILKC